MQEWYSVSALAESSLPDMPTSERGINAKAKRECWNDRKNEAGQPLVRRRKGRGGGLEFHYSLLPARAQATLANRSRTVAPEPVEQRGVGEMWEWFEKQKDAKKKKARERLAILQSVNTLAIGGLQKNVAVEIVAKQCGKSSSSIFGWFKLVAGVNEADWLPHLAPRNAGRTATVECQTEAFEFLKGDYLRQARPPFEACFDRLQLAAREHGWTIPSARTLQRRIESEIPKPVYVYLREGPDALKRMYPPQERDRSMFHALEAVNVDGHKWDVFVKWPDGTIARPMMVAIQDLFSNKILSWRIDTSENTHAVRLAFKDCFEQFGIPDRCYLDNGRAFASKYLSGGAKTRYRFKVKADEPVGVLTALGIQLHWTTPYSGQSKPIERAFKDMCDRIAKHPAFEGAYTGNKPEAKPENYGSRAVPIDQFIKIVDQGIAFYNAKIGRRTRVCAGQHSFDQVFEKSYAANPIRQAGEEQLAMCLLAAESVSAHRQHGSVNLLGNRYWSECLHDYRGQKLTIRFDPDNLHAGVRIYRLDGVFVGIADCIEAAGFNDAEAARQHNALRKSFTKKTRELAALESTISAQEVAALLDDIEVDEAPRPETKLVRAVIGNTARVAELPADAIDADQFSEMFSAGLKLVEGGRDE